MSRLRRARAERCHPAAAGVAPSRVSVKGRDCWWTVLVIDPLAGPLVRVVYPVRWVTPNLLTGASVVVAFGAALSYALGIFVAGALLFQVSFLLDCMDGKLAHTRGVSSPYGPYLDSLGDAARFVTCTGALAYAIAANETRSAATVAILALFPAIHHAVLVTQKAWPNRPQAAPIAIEPSPRAFLRAAPRRLSKPATTVDTEGLAFTVGPIVGLPFEGILAASAIDALRLALTSVARVRRASRASSAG